MTQTLIKEQIKTIQTATAIASKSKETALKFLRDAGIVTNGKATSSDNNSKKK